MQKSKKTLLTAGVVVTVGIIVVLFTVFFLNHTQINISEKFTGAPYSDIDKVILSPDNKHIAYLIGGKNGDFVVLDNKKTKTIPDGIQDIPDIVFSPDSKHIAYLAAIGDMISVAVDGKRGKGYYFPSNSSMRPVFSPDSKHIAYVVGVGSKWAVAVDGKIGKSYDKIKGGSLAFSPDGKYQVYLAGNGRKCFAVINGKDLGEYDSFAKKSKIIFDSRDSFHFIAVKNNKGYCLVEIKLENRFKKLLAKIYAI